MHLFADTILLLFISSLASLSAVIVTLRYLNHSTLSKLYLSIVTYCSTLSLLFRLFVHKYLVFSSLTICPDCFQPGECHLHILLFFSMALQPEVDLSQLYYSPPLLPWSFAHDQSLYRSLLGSVESCSIIFLP